MKKILSKLLLLAAAIGIFPSSFVFSTSAFTVPYDGLEGTNYYASSVVQVLKGHSTDVTDEAQSTDTEDVKLGAAQGKIYIGFNEEFDGVSLDIESGSTGGSYVVKYWDGSGWENLISEKSADFENDGSKPLHLTWNRPADWDQKVVSGSDGDNYYYISIEVVDAYNTLATLNQIGILDYNLILSVEDQLGNAITGMDRLNFAFASSSDGEIFESREIEDGVYAIAYQDMTGPSTTSIAIHASGMVQASYGIQGGTAQEEVPVELLFGHRLSAVDAITGKAINISSATAGTKPVSCKIHNSYAYCPVAVEDDNSSSASVVASGYKTGTASLPNRLLDSSGQELTVVKMVTGTTPTPNPSDTDLVVDDLYFDGSKLQVKVQNQGDRDANDDAKFYVYVDGHLEYSTTVDQSSLERGETRAFSLSENTLGGLTENHTYEIKACIDPTKMVDESDDSNNCRTENLKWTSGSSNNNGTDLVVKDLYFDNEDLHVRIDNDGNDDANEDALLYIYVDGDKEYARNISQTYLEGDDSNTFSIDSSYLGNLNRTDTYEFRACIDPNNDVNETDNSNNCRTEDLKITGSGSGINGIDLEIDDIYLSSSDDLFFVVQNSGDKTADASDGDLEAKVYVDNDFVDTVTIDQNGSTYLNGGEKDTVDAGKTISRYLDNNRSFNVKVCIDTDNEINEANENNNCMTVKDSELQQNSNNSSCGNFRDLSDHWAEEYVCELFDRDVVDGRSSYYFYPDSQITRAEFLKIAMLGLDMNPYYTAGIYFSDVKSNDWFSEYVTYAAAHNIVEGYDDGSFHPNSPISRGEAVVLLLRAVQEATNDKNMSVSFSAKDIDYSDVDMTDYFAYAVAWADQYNLVEGYSNNRFGPSYNLTRAEASKIIDLAYQKWVK